MKFIAIITVCVVGAFFVNSIVPITGDGRENAYIGGFIVAIISTLVYDLF